MTSLWRSVSVSVITRGLAILSTLLFTSLLSFLLQPDAYGLIGTSMSAALFVGAFGEFGQKEYMTREVSKALIADDDKLARELISTSTLWAGFAGLLSGIALGGIDLALHGNLLSAFVSAVVVFFLSLNGAWSGAGRAYGSFFWAIAPRDVFWRLGTVLLIAAAIGMGAEGGTELALLGMAGSLVLCVIIQLISLGSDRFDLKRLARVDFILPGRQMWAASRDLTITNLGGLILITLDVVLVGFFMGERSAAEYYPANRVALLTFSIFVIFHLTITPRIVRAFTVDDFPEVLRLAKMGARLSTGAALAGLLAIYLAHPIFPMIFNTATDTTWLVSLILSLSLVINAALAFNGVVLICAGHERVVRSIMAYALPISAAVLVLAAWSTSMVGVALGVLFASTVRLLVEVIICKRKLGFIVTIWGQPDKNGSFPKE